MNIIYFHGLSIDTRSIKKNNLFLAIKRKKKQMEMNLSIMHFENNRMCCDHSSKINKKVEKLKVKNPVTFLRKFAEIKKDFATNDSKSYCNNW